MHPRAVFLVALAAATATAQNPITTNTRLARHVPLTGSPWVAGNWGYRNAAGRWCLQTRSANGLSVIDTTNPANATVVATVPGDVKEVKVYGNYAYATTDGGPTRIIDLTNPSAAFQAAAIATGAHTLSIQGTRLYLSRYNQSVLEIRDLAANPLNPPLLGSRSIQGMHDCELDGNTAYAFNFGPNPTEILDVTNPASIGLLGTVPAGNHSGGIYTTPAGRKILLTCDEQTGGRVKIWDVTNPAAAAYLSQYVATPTVSVHNVRVKGAYAYVAYYVDGLRVLDLSNPSSPVEVGVFDPNPTNQNGSYGFYTSVWDAYPYHDAVYLDDMDNQYGRQGAWIVDFFPAQGSACAGSGGVTPTQWWSFGPPSPGNADFRLRLRDARPNTAAWLFIGVSDTAWAGGALPMSLAPYGAGGCALQVSPDAIFGVMTDPRGEASLALPVPPAARGVLYSQWFVADPVNTLGVVATKYGKLILQ